MKIHIFDVFNSEAEKLFTSYGFVADFLSIFIIFRIMTSWGNKHCFIYIHVKVIFLDSSDEYMMHLAGCWSCIAV